ncbi:MAG: ABC transporter ATP-binding protein [Alphaproteobacteria bacterium]
MALDCAEFAARWGEVHALLGENGAGKSTLMTIACGLYAPDGGDLVIDGQQCTLRGPADAAARGIGMVHQHFKLVPAFTVLENVRLTCARRFRGQPAGALRKALVELAAKADLPVHPSARVAELSIAERQRVEILRTLLLGARILILDEPTAVLTDQEAESLLRTARGLAAQGACVVLISHKLNEVKAHADRVTVMRAGRTVARDLDARSLDVPALARLMVGEALPPPPRHVAHVGAVAFSVADLRVARADGAPAVNGLSFDVRAGEIYGLAGVGGNGQTELAEAVCGLLPVAAGRIRLAGSDVAGRAPARLRRAGLRAIPADRYRRALAADLDVAENYALTGLGSGRFGPALWASHRAMTRMAEQAVAAFDVRGAAPSTPARLLSGGNAQKLVLARELDSDCALIVAHSPTRGLDVRACADVHERLRQARDRGTAVLLISEDLDEILALADRIGVISRGRLTGEFAPPFARADIGHAMVGHA